MAYHWTTAGKQPRAERQCRLSVWLAHHRSSFPGRRRNRVVVSTVTGHGTHQDTHGRRPSSTDDNTATAGLSGIADWAGSGTAACRLQQQSLIHHVGN